MVGDLLRQRRRRAAPAADDTDADPVVDERGKRRYEFLDVLVGEHADDRRQLSRTRACPQLACKHLPRIRIVGNIEDPSRPGIDDLEPAGQRQAGQRRIDRLLRQQVAFPQRLDQRQNGGRILKLRIARKRWSLQVVERDALPLPRPVILTFAFEREIPACRQQDRTCPARTIGYRLWHVRRPEYGRHAFAHDARLLRRDGLAVVAEPGAMVQADVCDQAGVRGQGVDGIEPAAHADLENPGVQLCGIENDQRRQRAEFEIRQGNIAAAGFDALERSNDDLVRRRMPIDTNSLVVARDVRRGIAAGPHVVLRQDRSQHCDTGSLAVRAGDGDDQFGPGDLQLVQHGLHTLEAEHDFPG